jgi:conjugal transfer pilin signal peptidase TrbI
MNIKDKFFSKKRGPIEKAGITLLLLLLGAIAWLSEQERYKLGFQYDSSVDFRLGLIDKGDKAPHKGKYCAFKFLADPKDIRYGNNFVKRVACTEGENLTHTDRDFYCNGKYLGTAKRYGTNGKFLSVFDYSGPVPKGKFFAVGENMESLDSKFWGFADNKWVIGKVYGII